MMRDGKYYKMVDHLAEYAADLEKKPYVEVIWARPAQKGETSRYETDEGVEEDEADDDQMMIMNRAREKHFLVKKIFDQEYEPLGDNFYKSRRVKLCAQLKENILLMVFDHPSKYVDAGNYVLCINHCAYIRREHNFNARYMECDEKGEIKNKDYKEYFMKNRMEPYRKPKKYREYNGKKYLVVTKIHEYMKQLEKKTYVDFFMARPAVDGEKIKMPRHTFTGREGDLVATNFAGEQDLIKSWDREDYLEIREGVYRSKSVHEYHKLTENITFYSYRDQWDFLDAGDFLIDWCDPRWIRREEVEKWMLPFDKESGEVKFPLNLKMILKQKER